MLLTEVENMRKWTIEDEEMYWPYIEEAERDIEINGTISEEEFWTWLEQLDEEEGRERKYKSIRSIQNIRLRLAKTLGRISRRFIKA